MRAKLEHPSGTWKTLTLQWASPEEFERILLEKISSDAEIFSPPLWRPGDSAVLPGWGFQEIQRNRMRPRPQWGRAGARGQVNIGAKK